MKTPGKHISDATAKKIAVEYFAGRMTVTEICKRFKVSVPTVRYNAQKLYPELFDAMRKERGKYERKSS